MTVTYTLSVATSKFCTFHRLLFRWKGSVWQAVWAELLIWCLAYAILSIIYHLFLIKHHKEPAIQLTQAIRGNDERSKMMRRTIIRYLMIMEAIVFRDVSTLVRRRFPTMQHLVTSGLMSERELKEYDDVITPQAKYWLPIHWALSLITLAKDEGRITGEHIYVALCDRIADYRIRLVNLVLFDWVPVPLVYTQVVHMAVYSYFVVALFGRQFLIRDEVKKSITIYVPIMTILQFIFYVGWLKVAEILLNPLGEDDDDFECNWMIDRNLQVGLSVEECYDNYPPIERDSFWTVPNPEPLYTAKSAARPINHRFGSCANMVPTEDAAFMLRLRRPTMLSSTSSNDGQHESDDIVPVISYTSRNGDQQSVKKSGSISSLSSFIKQLQKRGRKMSNAFRRRLPSYDIRLPEHFNKVSSATSLDRDGMPAFTSFSSGSLTPPIIGGQPLSNTDNSDVSTPQEKITLPVPNIYRKRHSAPDALHLANRSAESSSNTDMLPVIEEEKDKSRRHSDESDESKKEHSSGSTLKSFTNKEFSSY